MNVAEISPINKVVKWFRHIKINAKDIVITIENKAAIISHMNVYTTSNLVHECRTTLNAKTLHSNIVVQWRRGHETCTGNISAKHTNLFFRISLNA